MELNMLCRLCASWSNKNFDIFSNEGFEYNLRYKICSRLRLEISENDYLPTRICRNCFRTLRYFSKFYKECHKAQLVLEEMYKKGISTQVTSDKNGYISVIENEKDSYSCSDIEISEKILKESALKKKAKVVLERIEPNINIGNNKRHHICKLCNFETTVADELSTHINNHFSNSILGIQCTCCNLMFENDSHLHEHLSIIKKLNNRDGILMNFKNWTDLEVKDNLRVCNICNRLLMNPLKYLEHCFSQCSNRTYNEGYKCEFCCRFFKSKLILSWHIKLHLEQTCDVKPEIIYLKQNGESMDLE